MGGGLKRIGSIVAVLALAAGIGFYIYYQAYARFFEGTDDARIEADQVAIASKLPGYVAAVLVKDNQAVAKGAPLARIDAVDFRTRVAAADADIAAATAGERAARASEAESRAAVAQARAALDAAQAALSLAEREVARYRPLVAAGAEPAARLSQLTGERDRARAEVAAARAALDQAGKRVASLSAQTATFAAQARAAAVQREAAANDLASTTVAAPIAGRVASRSVRQGQYVQPGQRLMTIVPETDLYVVANFKETQLGLMRPGQPADIRVDALPGVTFRGTVESITPGTGANFSLIRPENATGNFTKIVQRVPVRIRIAAGPRARKILVPGLSLTVEVDTRASREELDAIREEQEKAAR